MKKERKPLDKKQVIIIILSVVLAVTIGITIWALFIRDTSPALAPDYAPQKTEENALPIDGDTDGIKLQQPQGGGAVSLTYSKDVTIDLSEKSVSLMFANPSKSNQDMMVQIVIQDTVVAQSGLIIPGYQIKKIDLFKKAKLSAGSYDGKIAVYYYQQDSGEKAMINTEVPLKITVQE